MRNLKTKDKLPLTAAMIVSSAFVSSCTNMLPSQFLLTQQQQAFSSDVQINTKIDMLWVIDNSSSMDPDQEKLRAGFAAFAQKYLQPTWDIHVAAIPTDAYIANSIYSHYLSTTIPGSGGAADPYVQPLIQGGTYSVPTNTSGWNVSETALFNMSTGDYAAGGITINNLVPSWGPNYAKLLPGIHDGPVPGLCSNFMPYLLKGENQCAVRDSRAQTGTANCLNPASGQNSVSQCVNTVQNDTIHSGTPIVSTLPPTGTPGNAAWVTAITNNFIVNLTTGTAGHGSERGLGSVLQMLNDNEASGSASAFFRPGSLRVIIFISDEDDQTMSYSASDLSNAAFSPWTHYQCDQAGLNTLNSGTGRLSGNFCCTGGSCNYGTDGTTCPSKTIPNNDGSSYTYTVSYCPNPSLLMPVSSVKTALDGFFTALDGGAASGPNYFVVTVTGLTGDSIRSLQTIHNTDDTNAGAPIQTTADRSDRYISLGNLVGNGSLAMDITSSDYSPILDAIGNEIIAKKGTFTLNFPTTNQAEMTVSVLHSNGTSITLTNSQYTIGGTTLTITDLNFVLTLLPTDQIVINYQPSSSFNG
jgi:hypothetical protein